MTGADRCPWCSAELAPEPTAVDAQHPGRCPSCGASLEEAAEADLPGLTQVDREAIARSRQPAPRPRGILGFLSGEYDAGAAPDPEGSLAPPAEDVLAEMRRMEIARLESEAAAIRAELELEAAAAEALRAKAAEAGAGVDRSPGDDGGATAADESPGASG